MLETSLASHVNIMSNRKKTEIGKIEKLSKENVAVI